MAQPKYSLYKYVKLDGRGWRYCKAALYSNGKIKPNIVIVEGKEKEYKYGTYYLSYNNNWIDVGTDALAAQRQRTALLEGRAQHMIPHEAPSSDGSLTLAEAVDQYFKNLECRDCDPKTIRAYRSAVDPFVAQRWCEATDKTPARPKKQYIDQIDKQDVLDFMGWLKKQPRAARKHCNPMMLLMLAAVAAVGQSSTSKPAPELKQWDVWVGDWTLSGTAKDTPTSPEYRVNWHMHGHWILNGFFAEVDHIWKGNGDEQRWLEILSYDQIRKIHVCSGFGSDGTTWNLTATFDKEKSFENVTSTSPDGEVTTCHMTWVFSADRMTVSGTQGCEVKGTRWTAFQVKGTKSKTAH